MQNGFRIFAGMLLALLLLSPVAALADEWLVTKMRGTVYQELEGKWTLLHRGDVVADDRLIRTLENARAELRRDKETITLDADTEVRIHDRPGERFTTVEEHFGMVAIDAEVRNVQHFAVETPFLAAVVKGTRFEVRSGEAGSSVKVLRGRVAVEALKSGDSVLVKAGQAAVVGADGGLSVEGRGKLPVVTDAAGNPVPAGTVADGGGTPGTSGGGVSVGVDLDAVEADIGIGGGINVDVEAGDLAGVDVEASSAGVGASVNVGNTNVGVSLGGGEGVNVNLGGHGVHLGLGGLL